MERARALRRGLLDDRLLRGVTLATAGWLAFYALLTYVSRNSDTAQLWVGDGLYFVPAAPLLVLTAVVARRSRGRTRVFWWLLAGFSLFTLLGDATWAAFDVAGREVSDSVNGFYVVAYLFAAPAIVFAVRVSRTRLLRAVVDAGVVALALSAVGFHLVVGPLASGHGFDVETVANVSYAVLDVVVLMLLLTVTIAADEVLSPAALLVALSFAAAALTDSLYAYFVTIHGYVGADSYVNVGWQLEFVLLGLACLVMLRGDVEPTPRSGDLRDHGLVPMSIGVVAVVASAGLELQRGYKAEAIALAGVALLSLFVRLVLGTREKAELAASLEQALREQERLAITDPLTSLHNRRFFDEALELEAARSRRSDGSLGLLVLDMDHFKWINDRYGHQAGDDVLVETARRLEPVLRGGDLLARYGGEEFVVLLPDTPPSRLREIAERLRRAVSSVPYVTEDGLQLAVTVSVGGACDPDHARGANELLGLADKALYRAKALGRDQVRVGVEQDVELETHRSSAHEFLQRLGDEIDREQGRSELSRTISRWAELVAREMGLDLEAQRRCAVAARFHDIGKIAIPTSILRKRAQLGDTEWELVREHPEHGARLVALVPEFRDVAPLIRDHHERPDGTGYPMGKRGREISLEAAVISVCDAWAAMRTPRAYRPAHSRDYARGELASCRGTQFDSDVVDAFLAIEEGLGESPAGELFGLPVLQLEEA